MPGAAVTVTHASRAYGETVVLDDVSFTVAPGEMVALTGPSGSGKTTLLQLIGSLDRPSTGRIVVDDVSVGELSHPAEFRRATVGFVFQLHYLLASLSAQDNVELPLVAAHVPRRERAARALHLLEGVGLAGRARARPSELSGGERQRVAIARALAGNPRLILADEPTGSLDSAASQKVWELLSDVSTIAGATVIVASHDLTLAEHAGRALHLLDGRLVAPPEREPHPSEGLA
ncbi:MAG TPA: ABC transporter ATP-binding protein [Solirubrobacteraceae bacterium]|nr:ABC transporter ATP-binding protein [Solirubrobacteraceae bacterium]